MKVHRGLLNVPKGADPIGMLVQNIEFVRPNPFCGNRVPRTTAFLHMAGEIKYRFGGQTWTSKSVPPGEARDLVTEMLKIIDVISELQPNVVLLQCYEGSDGSISWHADDEKGAMTRKDGKVLPIVSFSLGADVQFSVRPKQGKPRKTEKVVLRHGDVLVMEHGAQELYEHAIFKGAMSGKRVSLTFRRQE